MESQLEVVPAMPGKKDLAIFAERVRKKAEERRLSLNKLSEKLGWGGGLLNKMLQGKRGIRRHQILEIAQALDCNPDELAVDTAFSFSLQSIEPSEEQQKITELLLKNQELENINSGFKLQEQEAHSAYERLAKENQKLKSELEKKELEDTSFKKANEENLRLRVEVNKWQGEFQRQKRIAEGTQNNIAVLYREYQNQKIWVAHLRKELEKEHLAGNLKAAVIGFGGLFLGGLASSEDEGKRKKRR